MARISGAIPNLANGVSQQAVALRLTSQGEEQINAYSTVVDGLTKRPPTQQIADLGTGPHFTGSVHTHIINRDANERYLVLASEDSIRVFGLDGTEYTVNTPDGYSYLSYPGDGVPPFKTLTVGDYTFLVNTSKTVSLSGAIEPASPKEAVIHILAGNYGRTYSIKINGEVVAQYRTPDGTSAAQSPAVDTTFIAERLVNGRTVALETTVNDEPNGDWEWKNADTDLRENSFNTSNGWLVRNYRSTIYIRNLNDEDFSIEVDDGYNGNAAKVVKETVQDFADLPAYCEDGVSVEIVGSPGNEFDNYYVKFERKGEDSSLGIWREISKPGIQTTFNTASMPHVLVREADGSFTFKAAEWDKRKAGDDTTAPPPSFLGKRISDLVFFKNRLGFLSGESCILSRAGSYFDWWRSTATALLDDDPIDVASAAAGVSVFRSGVTFADRLVLFSDQTQFVMMGNELLTPKTASIRATTSYASSSRARPAPAGDVVFFPVDRGQYSMIREYAVETDTGLSKAEDVSAHIPQYIPAGVTRLAASTHEDILVVLTEGEPSVVYVYKYYWADNRKLQSSWSKWEFPGVDRVLDMSFIDSNLYLITVRDETAYIEKMEVQPGGSDPYSEFVVHLDRRFRSENDRAIYNFENDETTIYLPVNINKNPDYVCVTAGNEAGKQAGLALQITSLGYRSLKVRGDYRDTPVYVGVPYEMRYTLSPIFLRTQSANGGTSAVSEGRLQLTHILFSYSDTAYFTVEITPLGRETRRYITNGRLMGDPDNRADVVNISSGAFKVPVMSKNDRVKIEIVSDSYLPSAVLSAEWVGSYTSKSRRI